MNAARRWGLLALSAWLLGTSSLGCAASASVDSASSGFGGSGPGLAGGGTGTGGSVGGPGSGGTSTTGTGATGGAASTGAGGSASGVGGTGGGAGQACSVEIRPINPPSLGNLPAGPGSTLRVRGVILGTAPPSPTLSWTITIETNSVVVPITRNPQDPTVIEFPLAVQDRYLIDVFVNQMPSCRGRAVAVTTLRPTATYAIRVTPPAGNPGLTPYEGSLSVEPARPVNMAITLRHSTLVSIVPQTVAKVGIPSYVRISPADRWWSREGDTAFSTAFQTSLADDDPALRYDVLVIPLMTDLAPRLFSTLTIAEVSALVAVIDSGLRVSGILTARSGTVGAPVSGATVVLRAGELPSTLPLPSDTSGRYGLQVRPGLLSAAIVPPATSTLPEARVDAAGSTGIALSADMLSTTMDFAWGALATTSLGVALRGSSGPAAGIDVVLDSEETGLPGVGTLTVTSAGAPVQTFAARGVVHRRAVTDGGGQVSFAGLARGRYRLVALPPVGSVDGLTVTPFDLAQDPPGQPVAITLAPKVVVSGRLSAAPANTRLMVIDDQPQLGRAFPLVAPDTDGTFSLLLDSSRSYHLVAEPPTSLNLSRVPLGPVETGTTAIDQGLLGFPSMVTLTGQVRTSDGLTTVPGALVQVFCTGTGPECVDYARLRTGDPLPLTEGLTDPAGAFLLHVPDPAP